MNPLPHTITIGDKYGPAMSIADQAEADAYFERLVAHGMEWGNDRAEAERIERANLGYYAGYFSHETRARVERFFRCSHPVFGSIAAVGAPTPERALKAGLDWMCHDERRSPPRSQQDLLADRLVDLPVYHSGSRPEVVVMDQPLTPSERDMIVAALRAHKPFN